MQLRCEVPRQQFSVVGCVAGRHKARQSGDAAGTLQGAQCSGAALTSCGPAPPLVGNR